MDKQKLTPEEKQAQKQLRIEEKQKNKELVENNKQLIKEKQLENKQHLEEIKTLREEDKVKKLEDLNEKLLNETDEAEKLVIQAKIKEYENDKFPDPVKAKIASRKIERNNKEIEVLKKANSALSPWIFARNIVILAVIALIMGAAIGLTHFITSPIIEENERKLKFQVYESVYPNATFKFGEELDNYKLLTDDEKDLVKETVFAFENDQFVGVIYGAEGTNQYGEIKILIAITPENKIKQVSVIENTNTPGFGDKAAEFIVNGLVNQDYNKAPDAYSGATHSSNLLIKLSKEVAESHTKHLELFNTLLGLEVTDPIKDIYGEYNKELDASFTKTTLVLSKHIITGENKSGFSYIGEESHEFDTVYNKVSGKVTLELFLDEEGQILAYDFLAYEHSAGAFKERIISYLDSFIGTNVTDIEQTHADNMNKYANSSETGDNVIYPILKAIMEVSQP